MNLLCFGKNGLLSTELQKWLVELNPESLIFLGKDECDITNNAFAADAHSSFVISERDGHKLRREVQEYWIKKGLKFV